MLRFVAVPKKLLYTWAEDRVRHHPEADLADEDDRRDPEHGVEAHPVFSYIEEVGKVMPQQMTAAWLIQA